MPPRLTYLLVAAAAATNNDESSMLQLNRGQNKISRQAVSAGSGEGHCGLTGDPHIKTFDASDMKQRTHCYGPMGDYYIVKTDKLQISGRYVGRRPRDDKQIPGFATLGGVVITGSLVGGQTISIPALDYRKLKNNYSSIEHFPELTVADGAPPLPLNCEPFPIWRQQCRNKPGNTRRDCRWAQYYDEGCGSYDTVSQGVWVRHGKGPNVMSLLKGGKDDCPNFDVCGACRCHRSTYTIRLLEGVVIHVNQGRTQNIYISTPCRSVLSTDGVIAGHCGDFNGDFENDKIDKLQCPLPVGNCEDATAVTSHLGQYGAECGVLPRPNKCTDIMFQEFEPVCARFFPADTQPVAKFDCITDCCVDRQECVDKDFEDEFAHCTMTGDPHIKTFDAEGPSTDVFFPHGDFYAFKSPQLTVQVRYGSERTDLKAQVFGVAITGPLVGKPFPDGSYPVVEIPDIDISGKRKDIIVSGNALLVNKEAVIDGTCGSMGKESCHFETDYFKATYGKGMKVSKYFDEEYKIQDINGTATLLKDKDGQLVPVDKTAARSVTVDFHHNDVSLAKVVVNNGKRQNILLEVRSLLLDTGYTGALEGQCVTEQSDKCNGSDKVPDGESLFSTPHPSPSVECPTEEPCPESLLQTYKEQCKDYHDGIHPNITCEATREKLLANCVVDCCNQGRCPVEDPDDDVPDVQPIVEPPPPPPPQPMETEGNCPPPSGAGALCSWWGDPHFSKTFKAALLAGDDFNGDHGTYHGHRGRMLNHYHRGLYKLFETSSGLKGQAFMCAAGGLTSMNGMAIKNGDTMMTWLRPAASGPPAFGSQYQHGKFVQGDASLTALEFRINGEFVDYNSLGDATLDCIASNSTCVEAGQAVQDVSHAINYGNKHFAQQFFLSAEKDRKNSVGPMCVGALDGTFTVKSSVPLLNRIFEPVVTVEVSEAVKGELLNDADSLCMRETNNDADVVAPVEIADSLFTAKELHRLCSTCGMVGLEESNGFAGCNPAAGEDTPQNQTPQAVCGDKLEEASESCSELSGHQGFFEMCLVEYCMGVGPDAPDVAMEALNEAGDA